MRITPAVLVILTIATSLASGATIMTDANARTASAKIDGIWGGRQIRLHANAEGTTIELDCAQGHIKGPIKLDKAQRFSLKGSYDAFTPGPQPGDARPTDSARYSGKVEGDTLTLDIIPTSGAKLSYTLTRGKNVKIIRCY